MAAYIALIRKEDGTDYGVEFPDFPGCISGGVTLDEALRNAREALELHVAGMIEDGQKIPAPSPLDAVVRDRDNAGAVAVLVEGPADQTVRVNVTFNEGLLARIDRFVEEVGFPGGRSGLLAQAARAAIGDTGTADRLVPVGYKLVPLEGAERAAPAAPKTTLGRNAATGRIGKTGAPKLSTKARA